MSTGVRTTARQVTALVVGLLVALLVFAPAAGADPSPSPTPPPSASPTEKGTDPCGLIYGDAKKYCERGQKQKEQKEKCADLAKPMRESCENGIGPGDSDLTPSVLDPMSSLADSIAQGSAWVVDRLSDALAVTSDVDFTNGQFLKTYALVFAASTFLVLLIWLWAVAKRAVRGVPLTTALGEAVGLLWLTVLACAFTPLVLYTVVNAVDGITQALAGGSQHAKFFQAFSEALTENNDGGPFVKIILSLVCMAAAGVLWIEMVIRVALLYVGAVLGTIVYSGLVDRELWSRVRRWVGIMAAVILVKPIVVVVLRLASALSSGGPSDSVSAIISGLAIILLAIIASAMIFRMIPGMGDEIIAARRDSYDPASRQAAALVTRPVSGITQGINTHASRDTVSRAPAPSQTVSASAAHASSGIAAHSTRPASSAPIPPRPTVPPQDNRGNGSG
ncbi:integral membrane protein (plasmid) [Streptomyces hygroscopicus subsp. jinggangensis 5008]|nr:integral membrane protein [Streptomyces hygroscopicus subsp. jinggangensis 5008]AGF68536.1 integral membrane protein [Streptomyces hygroscopicus subsp. jinggangensis TL01]